MKKSKVNQSPINKATPRSRINSNYSSASTTSLKKKIPSVNNSKQKQNNKENQTNNVTTATKKKPAQEDKSPILTSINGFKNIKAKVADPKKINMVKDIVKNNIDLTKSNKKTTCKTTVTSARSTPRAITRPSILIKDEEREVQKNTQTYIIDEKSYTQKKQKKLAIRHFKLGKKIRQNQFSSTFKAIHSETGIVCCLKVIEKKVIKEQSLEDQLISQIKIRSMIHHPNMIQFYGYFSDEINFYLIEELHPEEPTLEKQIQEKRRFKEKYSGSLTKQLLDFLKYLHSEEIIHRDLRNENISSIYGLIKVTDFSWIVSLAKKKKRDTFCGSFRHVPPELINGISYNYSIDVWNLGVSIYQMITGINPFSSDILTNLQNLTFPIFLSNQIVDLLGKILIEQNKRIGLEEIESHEWMKNHEMNGFICKEFWSFWK